MGWVYRCCVNVSVMKVETSVENIESCFKWIAKDILMF